MKIKEVYKSSQQVSAFLDEVKAGNNFKIWLNGLSGSAASLLCNMAFEEGDRNSLVILNEREDAAYFYNDLVNLQGEDKVLFFPSSYKRSIQYDNVDTENIVLRTDVLNKISNSTGGYLVVSYPEALVEPVITGDQLSENTLRIVVGEKISLDFVIEVLNEYEFTATDFVYEPGQFAVRGSIVDIFSFSNDFPYRIDFFGSEVDSIRSFEVEKQLSLERFESISIIPNIQHGRIGGEKISIFDFIKPLRFDCWINDLKYVEDRMTQIADSVLDKKENRQTDAIFGGSFLKLFLEENSVVEYGSRSELSKSVHSFHFNPQPRFNKNFQLIKEDLNENFGKGYVIYILSDNPRQIERLTSIFNDIEVGAGYSFLNFTLHEGFVDHDHKLCVYTDHQIFDRFHKFRVKKNFSRKESITIKELTGINPGDFVVHIDHGIGKFAGLEKVEVNGKFQEAVKLIYRDNDVLYVNIHSLHRISKYKGKDGEPPKIYKLGTGAWQKLKLRTKSKVKDIARDLIKLYAKRKEEEGFRFSPDTYLQQELEASFIYEDTPDQVTATALIKKDMESESPMDRLVCGDVGFGKTEVAIRAAFKAVSDSKQVAVLVPTTILALQHYTTFSERLKDFPCNVGYISRLVPAAKQKQTLQDLEKGKVDIIIGTHKIVGKEIKFKDLGLLIIDEEQKFGVAVKEKLKAMKLNVDTLTLTATPIPRTLQFSLMGARDLSIINTAPPNRHPIITELHAFNEEIISEAIHYETERGGQVFFIHNRVQNITEVEAMINRLCPKVKTVVAHGQMDGPKLENIMLDFMAGDYEVLIATTIIENGLDIPNANTIIINNANHFGLSDLHQLRGRVGRSNVRAFCYLLSPPMTMVTPEARRRLRAIEEFSDLGSGFNIAMQDLDIRGAGNLLGGEQSGFIADIGFETYQRILNEAMLELRDEEYGDLFNAPEAEDSKVVPMKSHVKDCVIDTDMELRFPEGYISNVSERIRLYRELDEIESEADLVDFRNRIADRFGLPMPDSTEELLNVVELRSLARSAGFEKIVLRSNLFIGYFIADPESSYFRTDQFMHILQFVQNKPNVFRMKEKGDKLSLTMDNVSTIKKATDLLRDLVQI